MSTADELRNLAEEFQGMADAQRLYAANISQEDFSSVDGYLGALRRYALAESTYVICATRTLLHIRPFMEGETM